jgi:hypothetical protein
MCEAQVVEVHYCLLMSFSLLLSFYKVIRYRLMSFVGSLGSRGFKSRASYLITRRHLQTRSLLCDKHPHSTTVCFLVLDGDVNA